MNTLIRFVLLAAYISFVTSCASLQTTNFYTLSKPLVTSVNKKPTPTLEHTHSIKILVKIPDGLKRPQIVINKKNNAQLVVLEQHRWLSSFDEELSDALTSGIYNNANIQGLATTNRYQIAVNLLQMDTILTDKVAAKFHWKITRNISSDKTVDPQLLSCEFSAYKPINNTVESAVTGMQDIVQDLIQIIAQQVTKMESESVNSCS